MHFNPSDILKIVISYTKTKVDVQLGADNLGCDK